MFLEIKAATKARVGQTELIVARAVAKRIRFNLSHPLANNAIGADSIVFVVHYSEALNVIWFKQYKLQALSEPNFLFRQACERSVSSERQQ